MVNLFDMLTEVLRSRLLEIYQILGHPQLKLLYSIIEVRVLLLCKFNLPNTIIDNDLARVHLVCELKYLDSCGILIRLDSRLKLIQLVLDTSNYFEMLVNAFCDHF
jgi:hypothetical protein